MINQFYSLVLSCLFIAFLANCQSKVESDRQSTAGGCSNPNFVPTDQTPTIESAATLLVTHPSREWDGREATRNGINSTIRFAKGRSIPVAYLAADNPISSYFVDDCVPSYWIHSEGGEYNLKLKSNTIISIGGNYNACQAETGRALFSTDWAVKGGESLRFIQVLDSIYGMGDDIRPTDSYYEDFQLYVTSVRSKHPHLNDLNFRLAYLEIVPLIKDPDRILEFLMRKQYLYDKIPSQYTILARYRENLITIRESNGDPTGVPPSLTLEFVDSAQDLAL